MEAETEEPADTSFHPQTNGQEREIRTQNRRGGESGSREQHQIKALNDRDKPQPMSSAMCAACAAFWEMELLVCEKTHFLIQQPFKTPAQNNT